MVEKRELKEVGELLRLRVSLTCSQSAERLTSFQWKIWLIYLQVALYPSAQLLQMFRYSQSSLSLSLEVCSRFSWRDCALASSICIFSLSCLRAFTFCYYSEREALSFLMARAAFSFSYESYICVLLYCLFISLELIRSAQSSPALLSFSASKALRRSSILEFSCLMVVECSYFSFKTVSRWVFSFCSSKAFHLASSFAAYCCIFVYFSPKLCFSWSTSFSNSETLSLSSFWAAATACSLLPNSALSCASLAM